MLALLHVKLSTRCFTTLSIVMPVERLLVKLAYRIYVLESCSIEEAPALSMCDDI